jgi:N-glycosylase/DNA lyase
MDKLEVVPVDTHVWQIAQEYIPSLKKEKLNATNYGKIQNFFQELFGDYCGWAHTLLFADELTFFKKKNTAKKEEKSKPSRLSLESNKTSKKKKSRKDSASESESDCSETEEKSDESDEDWKNQKKKRSKNRNSL